MISGSLWDDLQILFEVLFRLAGRLGGFAISCAFLYQAYQAWRSALKGINTDGSAPVPDPGSLSSRFGAVTWGIISLALGGFGILAVFGVDVLSIILRPWAR